ncbi:E3 ubiquitin-protein ligase [Lachnellula suecica]|uniref:RBR-type E3 ubiquitin transferase n=1 Tax=Lachnellula suecica TaxID=602035 RepID=A0A8T9CDX4_9HELO|nr:E3 ubiquitin-protein ligase [Lachnellula suecica]
MTSLKRLFSKNKRDDGNWKRKIVVYATVENIVEVSPKDQEWLQQTWENRNFRRSSTLKSQHKQYFEDLESTHTSSDKMIIPGGPPALYRARSRPEQQELNAAPLAARGNIIARGQARPVGVYGLQELERHLPVAGPGDSISNPVGRELNPEPPRVSLPFYGSTELPTFGTQYGIRSIPSQNAHSVLLQKAHSNHLDAVQTVFSRIFQHTEGSSHTTHSIGASQIGYFATQEALETSCVACAEDFSTEVVRSGATTQECTHLPNICQNCVSTWIQSKLDSNSWNTIQCPECSVLMAYQDIKRVADLATFSRYETLSLRSFLNSDDDFVWCRECDYGQVHSSGTSHPIIRCQNCGFRSCFLHGVPWHERLTCEEYDQMLQDPEGFQSALEKEEQEVELARLRQEEEDRRKDEMREARAEQEAEAARKRKEIEEERRQLKERLEAEALSISFLEADPETKQCPGCQHLVLKINDGRCDHMICKFQSLNTRLSR